MSGLRPVYCKYCRQTLLSDNLEKCSTCGKIGGVMDPKEESVAIADLVAQKQAEPQPAAETMGQAVGEILRGYRLLRLAATALVCIGLGLLLILVPDLRDDPRTISLNDVGRGLCTGLVGLVLVGLVFISTRRSQ